MRLKGTKTKKQVTCLKAYFEIILFKSWLFWTKLKSIWWCNKKKQHKKVTFTGKGEGKGKEDKKKKEKRFFSSNFDAV